MGQDKIEEKLTNELTRNYTTEREVVYTLAEVRKLLELKHQKKKYFALNFYCCWALHIRMNQQGAQRILARFDNAHPIALKYQDPDLIPEPTKTEIAETMDMKRFREDLTGFLKEYDLPNALVIDDVKWHTFLSLYTEVIEDCSLVLAEQGIKLKHIDEITVRKLRDIPAVFTANGGVVLFAVSWEARDLKTHRVGSWELYFTFYEKDLVQKIVRIK
jgi:hypothetical protein